MRGLDADKIGLCLAEQKLLTGNCVLKPEGTQDGVEIRAEDGRYSVCVPHINVQYGKKRVTSADMVNASMRGVVAVPHGGIPLKFIKNGKHRLATGDSLQEMMEKILEIEGQIERQSVGRSKVAGIDVMLSGYGGLYAMAYSVGVLAGKQDGEFVFIVHVPMEASKRPKLKYADVRGGVLRAGIGTDQGDGVLMLRMHGYGITC